HAESQSGLQGGSSASISPLMGNKGSQNPLSAMDFNVKKLASDAGVFFTRAVQFTEEKLGQAEKTELDPHLENLLSKADSTKNWTEKILRQTEILLQPNPSARIEEFIYDKLDKKLPSRTTNAELLGQYMLDAAKEFGVETPYGSTLITVGEYQKKLGEAEREFLHTSAVTFLSPLRNFLEGDWRTISLNHLRCLQEFAEAQATYYAQCHHYMQDLQRELNRCANSAGAPHSSAAGCPDPVLSAFPSGRLSPGASGSRKAKVLYDYDAHDASELSLLADEVRCDFLTHS
ncbi:hypothetical protein GOODEAATRI_004244, partial [Goodea atripinnis]